MKKDIIVPIVENVFLAAVQEWSDDFMEKVWYAYLINDSDFNLDSVMIVSKAFGTIEGEMKKTSLLRHRSSRCFSRKNRNVGKKRFGAQQRVYGYFFYWGQIIR